MRPMRKLVICAVALLLMTSGTTEAQAPDPAAGQIKGQSPDRGRPTRHDDEQPLLDFDTYFVGAPWSFEWDVPDGPLGEAGRITGTTTYKAVGGGKYEATTEAEGPTGKFTIKEAIDYQKDQKTMSRHVVDSRGFTFDEKATIGADLGGFYNILFESAPFTAGGRSVRMRHTMRLGAPLAYRVATSVSIDGGPFANFGNPWWRKQASGPTTPR